MANDRFERVVSTVLTICAVVLVGLAVRRQFVAPAQVSDVTAAPGFEPAWEDALAVGQIVGPVDAPVKVVVFSDLECPYCRQFHQSLRAVMREHQRDVSMVFVHFPLNMHRFAMQAARAAECAAMQGRFVAFVDDLFEKQDSLGLKGWGSFASEADVPDTAAIRRCARAATLPKRVGAGRYLGLRWQVTGTPTVIVNGLRFPSPPSKEQLDRVVQDVLDGKAVAPAGFSEAQRERTRGSKQ